MRPKIVALSLPVLLSSLFFGIALSNFCRVVRTQEPQLVFSSMLLVISLLFLGSFSSLHALLERRLRGASVVFLAAGLLFFLGAGKYDLTGILTCLILISGLFFFSYLVKGEVERYVKFELGLIFYGNIKKMLLFCSLIIAVDFYFSFSALVEKKGFLIPQRIVAQVSKTVTDSAQSFLNKQFEREFRILRGIDSDKVKVTPEGKVDLSGLTPEIANEVSSILNEYLKEFSSFLPLIISISLFLFLLLVLKVLAGICLGFVSFLVWVYTKFKIIEVKKEMREVERVYPATT